MSDPHAVLYAGDPRHPDHGDFLRELGRATYGAARVAGVCFDILRVYLGVSSDAMYSDPLGTLESRLSGLHAKAPNLPKLTPFLAALAIARLTRNDLFHALPVKDGLHRRKSDDPAYVRNFYTVDRLAAAAEELEAAWHIGSQVLYADGGAAVQAWYAAGGG